MNRGFVLDYDFDGIRLQGLDLSKVVEPAI
jgi:hypothetical protein